jgi:hypothetical protein
MKPGIVSRVTAISIGVLFVMYGLYALVQTRLNPQVLGITIALVSVAGGIGLMLNRRWSRYCIYVVSMGFIGTWLYYVAVLAMRAWPYDTLLESVISLVPGLFMVFVAAGSSYVVRKHFGAEPTTT